MNHLRPALLSIAVLLALAGCGNLPPGDHYEYGANGTGTTPGWENQNRYPMDPRNAGYQRQSGR